jgi:hypothetical protein
MTLQQPKSPTTFLLTTLGLRTYSKNPPRLDCRLARFEYLRIYALDTAYIPQRSPDTSARTYRLCTYNTIQVLLRDTPRRKDFRVKRNWSEVKWDRVWRNLWEAPVDMAVKDMHDMHDILPTKVRLKTIGMSPYDICAACHLRNTIPHRLVECGDVNRQWSWFEDRLGMILRCEPRVIPAHWLFWPPQKHRATLWFLAQMVAYKFQRECGPDPCDLYDFFKRARWKLYDHPRRMDLVGNYLSVLD